MTEKGPTTTCIRTITHTHTRPTYHVNTSETRGMKGASVVQTISFGHRTYWHDLSKGRQVNTLVTLCFLTKI